MWDPRHRYDFNIDTKEKRREIARNREPGAADVLQRHFHFAVDADRHLYVYGNGRYHDASELLTNKALQLYKQAGCVSYWGRYTVTVIAECIRASARQLWDRPRDTIVNLTNGLFDLKTGKLYPHTHDWLSPVQLPFPYNPHAQARTWPRFVETTFPEDSADIAWKVFAWLMVPNTKLQKCLFIVGEGGNGKSTYISGVEAFLGDNNVCSVSIHAMASDKFAGSMMRGKLANMSPDLPVRRVVESSLFKQVTGEDSIEAERKYGHRFKFNSFARMIFSANRLPDSKDTSEGWFRRFLILPFDRTFEPNPRLDIVRALGRTEELSYCFNRAVEFYPVVMDEGIVPTPSMSHAMTEFREMADPVLEWLRENIEHDAASSVDKEELYARYKQDCMFLLPYDKSTFGKIVIRFYNVRTHRTRIGALRVQHYKGIRWKQREE